MNFCSHFERLLQDKLHFLCLLCLFMQDLVFYLQKYYGKYFFFFFIFALMTFFSFWIEGARSTMCLVSSDSQISETALVIRSENKTRKHHHRINLGSSFSQSYDLHTDSSQTGSNLSNKLLIENHSHGSDCYALSRSVSVESRYSATESLQLVLRILVAGLVDKNPKILYKGR